MVAGPRTTSPSASRKVLPCQGQVTQSWRICRRPAVRPCECRWHRSPGRRHLGGKQDRHPRSVDLPGRAVGRIRHGAHLCPRVWSRGPGGVVDVDGLDEGEVSAEVTADKQGCASSGSSDQSLSPVAAVGTAAAMPAQTSTSADLASRASSNAAIDQAPIGRSVSSGCSGCPSQVPLSRFRTGRGRTTRPTAAVIGVATRSSPSACSTRCTSFVNIVVVSSASPASSRGHCDGANSSAEGRRRATVASSGEASDGDSQVWRESSPYGGTADKSE